MVLKEPGLHESIFDYGRGDNYREREKEGKTCRLLICKPRFAGSRFVVSASDLRTTSHSGLILPGFATNIKCPPLNIKKKDNRLDRQ